MQQTVVYDFDGVPAPSNIKLAVLEYYISVLIPQTRDTAVNRVSWVSTEGPLGSGTTARRVLTSYHTLCPMQPRRSSSRVRYCCACGGGPFKSEGDLNRHVKQVQDVKHQALRNLVEQRVLAAMQTVPVPPQPASPEPDPSTHDIMDVDEDAVELQNSFDDAMAVDEEWPGIDPCLYETEVDHDAIHEEHLSALDLDDVTVEKFPDPRAGQPFRRNAKRPHAAFEAEADKSNLPFYPFASELDYDIAQWIVSEPISNSTFDRLMKKKSVCDYYIENTGYSSCNRFAPSLGSPMRTRAL